MEEERIHPWRNMHLISQACFWKPWITNETNEEFRSQPLASRLRRLEAEAWWIFGGLSRIAIEGSYYLKEKTKGHTKNWINFFHLPLRKPMSLDHHGSLTFNQRWHISALVKTNLNRSILPHGIVIYLHHRNGCKLNESSNSSCPEIDITFFFVYTSCNTEFKKKNMYLYIHKCAQI